ncbi:MAG: phosphatidylglycerophosphatase A [Planctomycetes bacterium]|nr:phosphatidylglycerophosphatase A [Planctomycetota bacterium]
MFSRVNKFISILLGTLCGIGFLPKLQATCASAVIYPLMFWIWPADLVIQLSIITIVFFVGTYASYQCSFIFNKKDPRAVVIDELSGITFSLFMIQMSWIVVIAGFFLFRFFDILKPLGIRSLEVIPNGFGIMLDDVLAGIYTGICLHLLLLFQHEYNLFQF